MILSEGRRKAGSLKKTSIVWDRDISVNRREKARFLAEQHMRLAHLVFGPA